MAIASFDGVNKIVTITATGPVQARSLYSRWLDWACDATNAGYARALDDGDLLTTIDQKGAITNSVQFTLLNGWKVESTSGFSIVGGQFVTDDGSAAFIGSNGQIVVAYHDTSVSNAPDIADAVWTATDRTLNGQLFK